MPKDQTHKLNRKGKYRHDPLYKDLTEAPQRKQKQPKTPKKNQSESYIPEPLSKKLLKQVQKQQSEIEREKDPDIIQKHLFETLDTNNESEVEEGYDTGQDTELEHDVYEIEAADIDPADEAALEMFMGEGRKTLDLRELILQKLKEKEMMVNATESAETTKLEPKIISVYTQIAPILQSYRSGKLPKAIKILPLLSDWEEILYLTRPENWSPQAVRMITRIFASNFNEKPAQKYYYTVLLPQLREDIKQNKKLNWHIYMALKKAAFKPAAFYKGILIPLCEAQDCSLREAVIVSSVIRKVTIPVMHSSVALMKIAEMPYSGANSIFIRVLINKKYALPIKVIDALADHFLRFRSETRSLPVLWHQALLAFAQRYKQDITAEQKGQLKLLLREHSHPRITQEIRRELFSTKCRGEETATDPNTTQMDTD
jgi:essential nuclear protein 1